MKRLFAAILLIGLVALNMVPESFGFDKIKIAVLDFQMQGQGFENDDMGKIIAEWLTTAFVKEGRFDVVERRLLSKVLGEQELAVSGVVNTNTATELGKLLGVKIVITGSVIKLSQQIEVNARIIDVENASIIAAENVRAIQTTKLEELVVEMSRKIIRDFPLTGYVVSRKQNIVMIDLGRNAGIKQGLRFTVYKEGKAIKHPKTGEVLYIQEIPTGIILIDRPGEKISHGRIVDELETDIIQYGQLVKVRVDSEGSLAKMATAPAPVLTPVPVPELKAGMSELEPVVPTSPPMAPVAIAPSSANSYRLAIFPTAFRQDGHMVKSNVNSSIRDFAPHLSKTSTRTPKPSVRNLAEELPEESLWNRKEPNTEQVLKEARKHQVDVVLMYYIYFRKGQGLANGWGTDFIMPNIKTFFVDVKNQKVSKITTRGIDSRDQLGLELKRMSQNLLKKYEKKMGAAL